MQEPPVPGSRDIPEHDEDEAPEAAPTEPPPVRIQDPPSESVRLRKQFRGLDRCQKITRRSCGGSTTKFSRRRTPMPSTRSVRRTLSIETRCRVSRPDVKA